MAAYKLGCSGNKSGNSHEVRQLSELLGRTSGAGAGAFSQLWRAEAEQKHLPVILNAR
jgi:hypothetical protein